MNINDLNIEITKISTRQEAILEKLSDQNDILKIQASTLDKQSSSLDIHIRRTEINEEAIFHIREQTAAMLNVAESIKKRIEPLESESIKRVAIREFLFTCIK